MTSNATLTEDWYCWKELLPETTKVLEDGTIITEPARLITPWSDEYQYEFPFDYLYQTEQEAIEAKEAIAPDEPWYLCKEILIVIRSPI